MRLLYLIDSSVYIFRAWFSIGGRLVDEAGDPANAVYGYGNFLLDFLEGKAPEHALAAFDQSLATCFRNDIYPGYKANRPEAPEDLKRQMGVCQALTRALGVTALSSDRYEADDLIGTVATRSRPLGFTMRYLTSDKDYAQLLEPGDRLVDASGRRNLGCDGVPGAMGVRADQVPDLLGLAGDSVDNIPGVPGIGPRTAQALLNTLGSLEGIYADLERVGRLPLRGAARVRRLLAEHRDIAFLSRRLATIHRDAPLAPARAIIRVNGADGAALDALALPVRVRRRAELRMREESANALVNH